MELSKRRITVLQLFQIICVAQALKRKNIVDGEAPATSELKYVVEILVDGRRVCAGGIIGESHILTAAHCVIDDDTKTVVRKSIKIAADTRDLSTSDSSRIDVEVEEVYVPVIDGRYWSIGEWDKYDIAVLKLKKSFHFNLNENVEHLSLPRKKCHKKTEVTANNNQIYVIGGFGWDKVERSGFGAVGSSTGKLWKGYVRLMKRSECKEYFGSIMNHGLMCGRSINRKGRFCTGVSGAPLVPAGEDYVYGIVKSGEADCDDESKSSRFTSVGFYSDFVNDALAGWMRNMVAWRINCNAEKCKISSKL